MISVVELTKRFSSGGQDVLAVDGLSFSVVPGEALRPAGRQRRRQNHDAAHDPRPAGTDQRLCRGATAFAPANPPDEVKSRDRPGLDVAPGSTSGSRPRAAAVLCRSLRPGRRRRQARTSNRFSELFDLTEFLDRRCASCQHRAEAAGEPGPLADSRSAGAACSTSRPAAWTCWAAKSFSTTSPRPSRRARAVIVSTHRLDEAERLCDRFGLLHEGG